MGTPYCERIGCCLSSDLLRRLRLRCAIVAVQRGATRVLDFAARKTVPRRRNASFTNGEDGPDFSSVGPLRLHRRCCVRAAGRCDGWTAPAAQPSARGLRLPQFRPMIEPAAIAAAL